MWNGGGGPPDPRNNNNNNNGGYYHYPPNGNMNAMEHLALLAQQQQQQQHFLPGPGHPHYAAHTSVVSDYARTVQYEAAVAAAAGGNGGSGGAHLATAEPHDDADELSSAAARGGGRAESPNAADSALIGAEQSGQLAQASVAKHRQEQERPQSKGKGSTYDDYDDVDEDDDNHAMEVEAVPVEDKMESLVTATVLPSPPSKGSKSSKTTTPSKKKKTPSSSSASKKKKRETPKDSSSSRAVSAAVPAAANGPAQFPLPDGSFPTMDDATDPVSAVEYSNLETLMEQFCRVPLLAEFSRPVAVLHPELVDTYSKIIHHPIDLGRVCRRIRRRQYRNLREVRLDCWRIFANCVRYHSHPNNKNAVPSFVSIALHLRDYFNDLWQEYMVASDSPSYRTPTPGSVVALAPGSSVDKDAVIRADMDQRAQDRKKRLIVAGLSVMAGKYLERAADSLKRLLDDGGRVDKLDKRPIWGDGVELDDEDEADVDVVLDNLRKLEAKLRDLVSRHEELGVDELESLVRNCHTGAEGLENMRPALRLNIACRLDRYMGQLIVPIHEATCRGVSQSSIWGCMAAGVWARESSKKPFWPALVLGIIAPEDQREAWHRALTERNEERLPDKLKAQLTNGKRNAEKAIKRQSQGQAEPQSFFLVEFLGTHEFIWVREADIVENFNPEEDPNTNDAVGANKKKRVSRSHLANILSSKTYANAIDEITWALDEFELQLQDIGGDSEERVEDYADSGYTYDILVQSDDEGGEAEDDDPVNEIVDIDECNELLSTNGLLDLSAAGKRKREQIKKQQKAKEDRKQKAQKARKEKAAKAKKVNEQKVVLKEREKDKKLGQRELERRRRKRIREREKALKGRDITLADIEPGKRNLIPNKRVRAQAIVNGYVNREAKGSVYKPLALGTGANGVVAIPAALIDSTNLIGIALAFRAAAGELPMPDESGIHLTNSYKVTWTSISLKGKKTSVERSAAFKRQIEMLEKETQRLRASKKRRVELLEETKKKVAETAEKLAADDRSARTNPLKKAAKKPNGGARKKRKRPPTAEKSTNGSVVVGAIKEDTGDEQDTEVDDHSEVPDLDMADGEPEVDVEAEAEAAIVVEATESNDTEDPSEGDVEVVVAE